jgi:hypothetical protein
MYSSAGEAHDAALREPPRRRAQRQQKLGGNRPCRQGVVQTLAMTRPDGEPLIAGEPQRKTTYAACVVPSRSVSTSSLHEPAQALLVAHMKV